MLRSVKGWLAGFLVLAAWISTMSCGGNGTIPGGGNGALFTLGSGSGRVVLPAGVALALETLRASTPFGTSPVNSAGDFTVPVITGGPMPVTVFSGDDVVLYGYVGGGHTLVTADSTAEFLAYLALAGFLTPPEVSEEIQSQLKGHPELAAVAAKIAERMQIDPLAVGNNDSEIASALNIAAGNILNAPEGRGILINPVDGGYGNSVVHEGLESIRAINQRRRRTLAYVDQISYTTEDNVEHDAPQEITKVKLSPTTGVTSVVGALGDLISGKVAYAPVISDPVTVPVRPASAIKTKYNVTFIGIGFIAGDIVSLPESRKQEYRELALRSLALDLFLPVLLKVVIPANKEYFEQLLGSAEGLEAVTFFLERVQEVPGIAEALEPNAQPPAPSQIVLTLLEWVVESDEFKNACINALQAMMNKVGVELPNGGDLKVGFANISGMLKIIDAVLLSLDASAQVVDIARSKQAEIVEVIANRSKVLLDPPYQVVGSDAEAELTARVPDASGTGDLLKYHWTCTGQYGRLKDGIHEGNDFESSKDKVVYAAWSPYGIDVSDKVTVEAFLFADNEWKSLGTAEATVDVRVARVAISPVLVAIKPGESMAVEAFVTPAPPANEVFEYKWITHGTAGSFNGVLEKVGPREVTYVAGGAEGTDKVTVQLFRLDRAKRIFVGEASADVKVETEPSVIYGTIRAVAEVQGGFGGWSEWHEIFVEFPDVPGATSYRVQGFDAYWWGNVDATGPPFTASRPAAGHHGFALTGGSGWGFGEPPTEGELIAEAMAYAAWRFPGDWPVTITK